MPDSPPPTPRYRFGPFELDPAERSLARNGIRVRLQDLPYRLLVMLVERPGEIVTREEVRQRLWPQDTFVEFDNSLGVAIRKIRDALSDDAGAPRYVETLLRRGYRFRAPVTVQEKEEQGAERPIEAQSWRPTTPVPASGGRLALVALLALMLVGDAVYAFRLFPQDGQADDELAASVTLMEGLLRQDKFAEAAEEKKTSSALAAKSTNELNRLQFDLVSARGELGIGHIDSSRTQLERILRSAQAHQLAGVELETRLTLAELETKLDPSAGAQADLLALEKVAHDKGFGLIASKAQAIRHKGDMRSR